MVSRPVLCRTGFATPSAMFCLFCRTSLPDGVCNPVRNVLSVPGSISFGRGCKPRPAILARPASSFARSGLPYPGFENGFPACPLPDGVCNPVRNVLSVPGSKGFGRGCKPRPAIEFAKLFCAKHIPLLHVAEGHQIGRISRKVDPFLLLPLSTSISPPSPLAKTSAPARPRPWPLRFNVLHSFSFFIWTYR